MSALTIDGSTRLYGIVGDPISQVKTPQLMNAYFQQQGINAVCVPLQVAMATFEASLRGIMALGNIAGLVITVPHKIRACAPADALSAQARQVGAVNVLRRDAQGAWFGDMFDGAGLVAGLRDNGFTLKGQHVKQLGAGGSGAAVAFALLAAGAASLTLYDPNGEAAQALPAETWRASQDRGHTVAALEKAAAAVCDFYLAFTTLDGIPYWDTGAPGLATLEAPYEKDSDPTNAFEPVDSSAAAIAAQGLLRFGAWLDGQHRPGADRYRQAGLTVLQTLLDDRYLSLSPQHQGLLLHSQYHRPNGWDYVPEGHRNPFGEATMWGDYHLRELALYVQRMAENGPYLTFFSPLGDA